MSKICLSDARLHTTALGAARIGQNLGLTHDTDVMAFCRAALAHTQILFATAKITMPPQATLQSP
ncbi:MAG: DUF3781 domain-containing protein [Pseudomonadota bacterium]|nr:DUF3781 domain-containing protein [Pseudomonadota bacterium]